MGWLFGTALTVLRKHRVRLSVAGLALAAALSVSLSLALQPRTGGASAALSATAPQPIDVSFRAADRTPSRQTHTAQTAQSSHDSHHDVHTTPDEAGHELSRAQATALVQHRYRARVVRSHLVQSPTGRPMYEFRLLASGSVWTVHIDAYSGAEVP